MNFKKISLLIHISIISVLVTFGIGFFCFSLIFSSKEPDNPKEASGTYTTPADKLQSPIPRKQNGEQEVSSQKTEERSEYRDISVHSTTSEENDVDISLETSSIHDEVPEEDKLYLDEFYLYLEETERNIEESHPSVEKQETYPVGDLRRLTPEERQHYEQLTVELQALIRKQPKTIEERKEREKEHIRRLVELHNKLKPYYKKLGFPEPPEGW